MDLNVLTLRHPLTLARIAWRKLIRRRTAPLNAASSATAELLIDPAEMIRTTSLDELNERAEHYFSSLGDWTHHLSKPFANIADVPGLLINFGVIVQGLQLAPRLRVLDFGAGSGWTSRFLTQLGCEVIVLDVSPTALKIARAAYERMPVVGDQPPPAFLLFDGRRIDLPDESVDRILCFDAFHHAPNPDEILGEFARILRPGGIAAFAEPGPGHSKTEQSQSEMKTYGVLENDVDIHAIWRRAQQVGFSEIRLNAYNVPPHHLTLAAYEDLLRGGEAYLRWSEATRYFLRDVRSFYLHRAGNPKLDSRQPTGLSALIEAPATLSVAAGTAITFTARVTNTGPATWLPSTTPYGGVSLGIHLLDPNGQMLDHDFHWAAMTPEPREVAPGETLDVAVTAPPLPSGRYTLELDAVANHVCWFEQAGSLTRRVGVEVGAAAA